MSDILRVLPKRQKQIHGGSWREESEDTDASIRNDLWTPNPSPISPSSALSHSPSILSSENWSLSVVDSVSHGRKRFLDFSELDEDSQVASKRIDYPDDTSYTQIFADCSPATLSPEERNLKRKLVNPFMDVAEIKYTSPRKAASVPNGVVNGYIKFALKRTTSDESRLERVKPKIRNSNVLQPQNTAFSVIPSLPADFGIVSQLNELDKELWKFYHVAFCKGRTLMRKNHAWSQDFSLIATHNQCVMHAILSISATYVMDYSLKDAWRDRANYHIKMAAITLNKSLRDHDYQQPGGEDRVVTALNVLACEDIISHEHRRPKDKHQRWYHATQNALDILDVCNPGFNYVDARNVQTRSVRMANANLMASYDILAHPVMELPLIKSNRKYKWLLNGTQEDQRRIHDATGVCPKLLHILFQITSLTIRSTQDPHCRITPRGASLIKNKLTDFRQWSELSQGYPSEAELFNSCKINEFGQVSTVSEVTDLTAQAWVSAAQIYLQCRFYRRPRSHPFVKRPLGALLRCVKMMPSSGNLFTSQSPFFPIFIMSVVSVTKEERDVARRWFDTVAIEGSARSSVPPVWEALKRLWNYMDIDLKEDISSFEAPIGQRIPWWEQMVAYLTQQEGLLSLS